MPYVVHPERNAYRAIERFWTHVERGTDDECWPWTGCLDPEGYGRTGRAWLPSALAHRVAYYLLVGSPGSETLDHTCRVRRCCNPRHLEPVSIRENVKRGLSGQANRDKTLCPAGHPYDAIYSGRRRCRTCSRIYDRDYKRRKRAG